MDIRGVEAAAANRQTSAAPLFELRGISRSRFSNMSLAVPWT